MKRRTFLTLLTALLATTFLSTPAFAQKSADEVKAMLDDLDSRQRALGDYKALIYMEQSEKGKEKLVYQAVTYRREQAEKFTLLFVKPTTEAGKGYLLIDRNLFLYDPSVGKWERRTERERVGGTDSTRQDFDVKNLSKNYDAKYVAAEKLGKIDVHHLELRAKKDAKVAFPVMHLWLDAKTNNMLKQQDMSLSNKLLRTLYYPKWAQADRPDGSKADYPREIRIYDELNKGNETILVLQEVEIKDLPDNIFTKAWLESKSR